MPTSVMAHRIGIEVAEVSGNHERNTENPLSGSRVTKNDIITKRIGSIINPLFPELLGSVMIEAMAASIAFQINTPKIAKGKYNRMEGRFKKSTIVETGVHVN